MFDNYVGAKTQKLAKWKGIFLTASVAIHVVLVLALLIRSFWVIEKLEPPNRELALAAAPPPPPPPPPPPAGAKKPTENKTKKRVVKDTVQPTEAKPDEDIATEEDNGAAGGVEGGVIGGVEGGVVGGSLEGMLGGIPGGGGPPPPPPPPEPPQVVPQQALEAQRVSGDKSISPDDETKQLIRRSGSSRVVATVKMCISAGGTVTSINVIKSSGYPAYDRKIQAKMREWRYRPFQVNGKATPVCSPVTFIYNQLN